MRTLSYTLPGVKRMPKPANHLVNDVTTLYLFVHGSCVFVVVCIHACVHGKHVAMNIDIPTCLSVGTDDKINKF